MLEGRNMKKTLQSTEQDKDINKSGKQCYFSTQARETILRNVLEGETE